MNAAGEDDDFTKRFADQFKYFNQYEKLFRNMNRLFEIPKFYWPELTVLAEQQRSIASITTDALQPFRQMTQAYQPLIQLAEQMNSFQRQFNLSLQPVFEAQHAMYERLSTAGMLDYAIPDELYPEIDELISSIPTIEEEQATKITDTTQNTVNDKKITWKEIVILVTTILIPMIQSHYYYVKSNVDDERHHQEIMVEMRKQTAEEQKQSDIQKQQYNLLMNFIQRAEHHLPQTVEADDPSSAPPADTHE